MDLLGRELYVGAIVIYPLGINDFRESVVIKLGKGTVHLRKHWTAPTLKNRLRRKDQSSCLIITPAELDRRWESRYEQGNDRRDIDGNFIIQGEYDWETEARAPEQTFTLQEMIDKRTKVIKLQSCLVQGQDIEHLGEMTDEEEELLFLP